MPHDFKLSLFWSKKQLKATLLFWCSVCITLGSMAQSRHGNMDPSSSLVQQSRIWSYMHIHRSGPDLMTSQLQPSFSQLHQPLCSTDNSWHGPPMNAKVRGRGGRWGGGFPPCMTLSYGVMYYSQFPCLWWERRNRLCFSLCRSLFKVKKPCYT